VQVMRKSREEGKSLTEANQPQRQWTDLTDDDDPHQPRQHDDKTKPVLWISDDAERREQQHGQPIADAFRSDDRDAARDWHLAVLPEPNGLERFGNFSRT